MKICGFSVVAITEILSCRCSTFLSQPVYSYRKLTGGRHFHAAAASRRDMNWKFLHIHRHHFGDFFFIYLNAMDDNFLMVMGGVSIIDRIMAIVLSVQCVPIYQIPNGNDFV